MTGNGLPIAMDLTAGGQMITLVFCSSDSQCASGYNCNAGICGALLKCRPGKVQYGALCYDPCPSGWSMLVAGICYAPCPSGFKDSGLLCTGCAANEYRDGEIFRRRAAFHALSHMAEDVCGPAVQGRSATRTAGAATMAWARCAGAGVPTVTLTRVRRHVIAAAAAGTACN
jgi:hypothetical protein